MAGKRDELGRSLAHNGGHLWRAPDVLTPEQMKDAHDRMVESNKRTYRRKKNLKELCEQLLTADTLDDDTINRELAARGLDTTEGAAVIFAQLKKARAGDTEAARFLRDTSGQKPKDSLEVSNGGDGGFAIDLKVLTDAQLKAMVEDAEYDLAAEQAEAE